MTELLILNFIQSVVVRRNSGVVDLLETNHDRVPNARLIDRNHFAVVVEPVRFRAQDLHLGTSRRADLRRFRLLRGVTLLNSVEKENSLSVKTKNTFPATSRRDARKNPGATRTTRPRASFSFFVKQKVVVVVSPLHTSKSSSSFAPETHHRKNFKKKKKNFPSIWSLDEEIRIFRFWTKKSPSKLWAKRRPLFFDFFPIFQGPRRPRRRTTTLKNKRKKRRKRLKKNESRGVVVGANANETTSRTSALTLKDALFDVCFL